MDLKDYVREIPDFPKPGILFRDITPLLKAPDALLYVVDKFSRCYSCDDVDAIIGIESRGFMFAAPLALRLHRPLIPVRKAGRLPSETVGVKYALEYGESSLEIHVDAVEPGQRILVVDDVLATGGTMAAAARLVEMVGGQVLGLALVIELAGLGGRDRLRGYDVQALLVY